MICKSCKSGCFDEPIQGYCIPTCEQNQLDTFKTLSSLCYRLFSVPISAPTNSFLFLRFLNFHLNISSLVTFYRSQLCKITILIQIMLAWNVSTLSASIVSLPISPILKNTYMNRSISTELTLVTLIFCV